MSRRKQANHNQRSKKYLLAKGYTYCEVTERWDSWAKRKHDLMGFCDMLALSPDAITAVQITSKDHLSTRATKITGECLERARAWLQAGGRILLIGWQKNKSNRWEAAERVITKENLNKEGTQTDVGERRE